MTIQDIVKLVNEKNVSAISLWFTDVLGQLKTVTVSYKEINDVLENGKFIDGSSIEGFSRIQESDLLLLPDFDTFAIIPFDLNGGTKIARLICDVAYPDGTPFEACPRQTLKRTLKKAVDQGYTYFCGPEMEYFYFKDQNNTELLDQGSYFDLLSIDVGTRVRERTLSTLEKMGIQCECAHHEVAPSSHEIGLKYKDALTMADAVITLKFIVKAVAREHEIYATFMPKPIAYENGSAMHTHQSLFKDDKNTFYDANDNYNLSSTAKSYTAGLLKYAPEFTMVCNQYINSYKRLVPGYEAPVYIAWGRANRTALVRVPATRPGKEKACRIEYRAPDPACNPYLAFSVMLGSGLKGIEDNLELRSVEEDDIYEMNNKIRKEKNIEALPSSLFEAKENFKASELMKEILGTDLHKKLVENKQIEWDEFRLHVTDFEIKKYLPIL